MRSNIIEMKAVTLATMPRDLVASGSHNKYKESPETQATKFDNTRGVTVLLRPTEMILTYLLHGAEPLLKS